jgi:hypothetical protein
MTWALRAAHTSRQKKSERMRNPSEVSRGTIVVPWAFRSVAIRFLQTGAKKRFASCPPP